MAILSFAHLKNKAATPGEIVQAINVDGASIPSKRPLSFAHLKRVSQDTRQRGSVDGSHLRLQRCACIGIEKTARLMATNYCRSCPRFWPADENERAVGVVYGRCMRSSEGGVETWQIIPPTAKVARCWYHLNLGPVSLPRFL